MSIVGEQLLQPEDGWQRIDNIDNSFKYIGLWKKDTSQGLYNNTGMYIQENATIEEVNSSYITFAFYGSKIRIFHTRYTSHSSNMKCIIDDIEYENYNIHGETMRQYLAFEKINLEKKIHVVTIKSGDVVRFDFDCVDIDEDGYMVDLIETKLTKKSTLDSMEIGDIISCRYTAPISGKVGYFSELGTCNCEGIDKDVSPDTPDGKFYFIKVDDNKLIADRNVQSSISWKELNKNKLTCKMDTPNSSVLDKETEEGFSVESGTCLIEKISEFSIGDTLYDLSPTKNNATISNCIKEYDQSNKYYYTIPSGGVAYNDDITISFPKKDLKSNEGDDYILEQSSIYSAGLLAYLAFNKTNIDSNDCWHSSSEPNPYIKVSSKKDKIQASGFRLTNRNCPASIQPPSSCIVYGSNDNTAFEKIYETSNLPSGNKATSYHHFNSQVEYLHYKFSFQHIDLYVAVGELEIFKEYEYENSSSSLINKNQGGWPIENDWDKYIRNSNLKEKIIAGDNEIWNYHNMSSLCKEKVITGLKDINSENLETPSGNILIPIRGKTEDIDDLSAKRFNICLSSSVAKNIGFRPVLITEGGK